MIDLENTVLTDKNLKAVLANLEERLTKARALQSTGWAVAVKEALIRDIENDIRVVLEVMKDKKVLQGAA